ncbi:hypothetical protein PSHT_08081 [Puccinia striiformis]|uniref:Nucleolar complex-associated protein 3 N-terminal domain-containing protein n=1 Tax=Puccinia striiformis TaxID=27350 RepID=A0A2S4VSJ8_9BASI|nr:hypothetical protein PSHT_08081 [Puccinia striiformis]
MQKKFRWTSEGREGQPNRKAEMVLGKRKTKTNPIKAVPKNKKSKPADNSNPKPKKTKGKTKAFIEIPGLSPSRSSDGEDSDGDAREKLDSDHGDSSDGQDLLDEDVDLGQEAMTFLQGLDQKGITRSSKDQKLENRKNRPKETSSSTSKSYKLLPKISNQNQEEEDENLDDLDEDDLALGSGDDDDIDLLSDMPSSGSGGSFSDFDEDDDDLTDFDSEDEGYSTDNSILEEAYFEKRKKRATSEGSTELEPTESKLPILHPDGKINGSLSLPEDSSRATSDQSEANQPSGEQPTKSKRGKALDPSLGARFGRKPLSEILSSDLSFKNRIQCAKLEIAGLAQEAISDPEMSLGSLKRLLAMCCPTLVQPHEDPASRHMKIDSPIRMMSILSLLAIFLDIIPGYRIRAITDAEKQTKISQMVARQREWEEGLVSVYRRYLEVCEKEVVKNTPLSACCLKSLCTLLQSKTHFNFSQNIMQIIVRKLGQREWDNLSLECAESITTVFKKDIKGDDSLQLVRLIVRTIKSRNYSVHPELLEVLLSLRLKNELSSHIRASNDRVYSTKDQANQRNGKLPWKDRAAHQKSKSSGTQQAEIISKKARKIMKARAGIEEEIAEAEETVKVEEKERSQTETLKMMFGCYFRIIKLPYRSALLPVALEDLLEVLRKHINGTAFNESEPPVDLTNEDQSTLQKKYNRNEYRDKLLCIVTAFELLSGQGEALNLDLTDIINSFYGLLTQIKLEEEDLGDRKKPNNKEKKSENGKWSDRNLKSSTSEMMIKVLDLIFFNRSDPPTPNRAIQFTKRLNDDQSDLFGTEAGTQASQVLIQAHHSSTVIKNLFKICPATDHARRDHVEQDELESASIDQLGGNSFSSESLGSFRSAFGAQVDPAIKYAPSTFVLARSHLLRASAQINK